MTQRRAELYTRYPVSTPWIYNLTTGFHFGLGSAGILIAYAFAGWIGTVLGTLYFVFAFGEMYVLMPLKVCPNCVYYALKDSVCVSGLNALSQRIARPGAVAAFGKRAQGILCPNNLYMASLLLPILAVIPGLVFDFSVLLLSILIALVALLVFRFFVLLPKLGCLHCRAKFVCPQAATMGVRER